MAQVDDNGALYWGGGGLPIEPYPADHGPARHGNQSAAIETTGYALLALLHHEDLVSASRTTKWLAGQRNALGGFGSTQDTVVSLHGLTTFSTKVRTNVDMTVVLESDTWRKEVHITPENADVLQTVQVPLGEVIVVTAEGKGDAVLQSVLRYNVPERRTEIQDVFDIAVDYGTDHVEVDDLLTVSASVTFTPPTPIEAGMVVLDVAVPTGFEPVRDTIAALVEENDNLKRFEIAGRKVILYIEDMMPAETVSFEFQARAKYPVRAKEVVSQVYFLLPARVPWRDIGRRDDCGGVAIPPAPLRVSRDRLAGLWVKVDPSLVKHVGDVPSSGVRDPDSPPKIVGMAFVGLQQESGDSRSGTPLAAAGTGHHRQSPPGTPAALYPGRFTDGQLRTLQRGRSLRLELTPEAQTSVTFPDEATRPAK